jgi:hypothetical protein
MMSGASRCEVWLETTTYGPETSRRFSSPSTVTVTMRQIAGLRMSRRATERAPACRGEV